VTAGLPEWMYPPRPSGWEADDLDHLPQAPRHTELVDGVLVFRLSPQRSWHSRLVKKSRPEPDVLVTTAPYDPDRTWYAPEDVVLVVEVVSDESAHRDRSIKPFKYAQAKIPHFWRVEDEAGAPVVHSYELDTMTGTYVATGIHRDRLKTAVPFALDLDLTRLVP